MLVGAKALSGKKVLRKERVNAVAERYEIPMEDFSVRQKGKAGISRRVGQSGHRHGD